MSNICLVLSRNNQRHYKGCSYFLVNLRQNCKKTQNILHLSPFGGNLRTYIPSMLELHKIRVNMPFHLYIHCRMCSLQFNDAISPFKWGLCQFLYFKLVAYMIEYKNLPMQYPSKHDCLPMQSSLLLQNPGNRNMTFRIKL